MIEAMRFGRQTICRDVSRKSFLIQCRVRRQDGAIAMMAAFFLLIIIGFFGLALDFSRMYNRRAEMQTLADSAVIAAAKKIDGTTEGINAAVAAARGVVEDQENGPRYEYVKKMTWDNAAISFAASRDDSGGWKTADQAASLPDGLLFVKVDTGALNVDYGTVSLLFMRVLSSDYQTAAIKNIAVAGKGRLLVTPFAVCAMSPDSHSKRVNPAGPQYDELVEYGFRRGVSYNLMNLNPNGMASASFQVGPISLAGSGTSDGNFTSWIYEPYICTGTMAVKKVTGASVRVQSPFPIGTYYTHLNSRFDPYTGSCNVNSSAPDSNVKQYPFATISWMSLKPTVQSAKPDSTNTSRLQTVADKGPPNHLTGADYGPLWSFARPVPWTSYVQENQGGKEPASGYTGFSATTPVWAALYGTDSAVGSYPASPPYLMTTGSTYFQTPTTTARKPGAKYRRVLNIPLLSCPVSGSSATVLAIGKFLMTVPAEATSVYGEFGGIVSDERIGALVEIYQ